MEILGLIGVAIGGAIVIALVGKGIELLLFGKEKTRKRGENVEQTGGGLIENPGRNSMHTSGPIDGGSGGNGGSTGI